MSARREGESPFAANRRLGRYRVHECLDRGGMGEVWRASVDGPGGFRKQVVLKTVRADLAARRDLVEMLIREAALAARLTHPNIVPVFDLDAVDGVYFFAMEYVPGHTLAAVLRQAQRRHRVLPSWFVAAVAAACADGLQYAHQLTDEHGHGLGLVHRDISLANVMVARTGNVTILDFGVATAARAGVGTRDDGDLLLGKFQYVPPEVVRGRPADRRCDVYALGVVVLIAATGAMPYIARDDHDLLAQIAAGPPPHLARRCASLPHGLGAIVERAMAHDRERRYADAASMAADLRDHLRRTGVHPTSADLARLVTDLFADDGIPELARGSQTARVIAPEPAAEAEAVDALEEVDIDVVEEAEPAPSSGAPAAALRLFPSEPVAAPEVTRGGDPFTSARPRPPGIFDGWSRTSEPTDDDPAPAPRWPWSR